MKKLKVGFGTFLMFVGVFLMLTGIFDLLGLFIGICGAVIVDY